MAPETVVRAAQSWLESSCQVQVPFVWLQACVEWIQEEAGGAARLTQQQINKQVYDQWLLTDLRDLDHPVLPEGLSQSQKTVLSGIFCVQIDSVLDISQPAYGQLQKWKGTDCANDEVSAVTDGVQNMEAMEYQPISALSTSLRPGVKLRLQGDIMCRLGMMLLGPTNVKLLGGEVDDLVDRNSQGRLLCRTLGLPEEEEPQPQDEDPPSAQQDTQALEDLDDQELLASLEAQEQREVQRQGQEQRQRGERQPRGPASLPDSAYGSLFESTHSSGGSAAWILGSTASSRNEGSTSSLRSDVLQNNRAGGSDWDQRHGNRQEVPPAQEPSTQDQTMTDEDFADEDFDDLPLDELDGVILQDPGANRAQNVPQNVPRNLAAAAPNPNDDFMDEDLEFIEEIEAANSIKQPNSSDTGQKISLSSPPFTYISLLDNLPKKSTSGKFEIVVKAFIVTLLGKLSSSDGVWKVGATISDGTGYLDVELSDEVLRGLLGFSVAEKAALKRDPARKGELEAGMRRCQEGLVDMCCVMTVCVELGGAKHVVTKAEPLKEQDLQALEARVKATK
ncbi:recQ-mediated genome instability protein 1 isoform X2 [Boleophthalmus pectinirostris]|uniref:recQ-mediated genome instability protein 1 isoform X2 n=1 Tax=Boleophthalmus pectinirostris TaxID=150288 RepID=UPI00243210AB|nr:recQ-mediated genome instability protein 1 isoform X2 [Boleophthalmus pectinirostris]